MPLRPGAQLSHAVPAPYRYMPICAQYDRAQAVQLAALHGAAAVDLALGQAAAVGRFAEPDLAAIVAHQACAAEGKVSRAGE